MTPEQLRAVLLERLPADPKWTAWVEGVVERVGTVEDPRIARIAALCDEVPEYAGQPTLHFRDLVRAVLGEAQPTPPHGTDLRDALIDVLNDAVNAGRRGGSVVTLNGYATRILALVRPVEGVVLTPEEARTALEGCGNTLSEFEGAWPEGRLQRFRDLERRLVRELP